ncbi:MAG: hypothetical protein IT371_17715 [Deltaproteobacteria bacterium]|nr:hypothetical protein [Deltaproteobacteria bacterium]
MSRPRCFIVICITLGACRRDAPPTPDHVTSSSLPPIVIKADRKLLYTYATGPTGAFETTAKLADVAEAQRHWVRVVDLAISPDRRKDHELVYVADLRAPRPDGSYPYVVVSRTAFEQVARRGEAPPTAGGTGGPAPDAKNTKVVLYGTSWCPACKAAASYLREHRVPFVEKDIEKDPQAAAELMQKARAAGISPSGVPVLDVRGTLLQGFDPQRLTALLGGKP